MENKTRTKATIVIIIVVFGIFIVPGIQTRTTMISNKIYIVLRYDDYGSTDLNFDTKIINLTLLYDVPISVAIVPYTCANQIRLSAIFQSLQPFLNNNNLEIAQHGYCHADGYNPNIPFEWKNSEFFGMAYEDQLLQIQLGKQALEQEFGRNIMTFIPPSNTYDRNTTRVLQALNFTCISGDILECWLGEEQEFPQIHFIHELGKINTLSSLIRSENGRVTHKIICVYFHYFDFAEDSDSRGSVINIPQYIQLLQQINMNPQLVAITFQQAVSLLLNK
jgi:predicted deacetylase